MNIKIIQEPTLDFPFAVIYKDSGLPSAPLTEGQDSALTQAASIIPCLKNVRGKKAIELGLVHRLDTATRGLLLIASTQDSYDNIQIQQKEGKFIKWYKAQVEYEGSEKNISFTVKSRFRPYGKKGSRVKPVFEDSSFSDKKKAGSKEYTTQITIMGRTAVCRITEGFRHQVRTHLAYSGFPIKGDFLYNENTKGEMDFEAYKIEFINPETRKKVSFSV